MIHIHKIRIFNKAENTFRYPDRSGHFYVHRVNGLLVFDNNLIWPEHHDFTFVWGVLQHCVTNRCDECGEENYEGDLPVMEISHKLYQHTLWLRALNLGLT